MTAKQISYEWTPVSTDFVNIWLEKPQTLVDIMDTIIGGKYRKYKKTIIYFSSQTI
jgi:hypothetical protein